MRTGLLIDPIDADLSYEENLKKASELGFEIVQLWYKDIIFNAGEKNKDFLKMLENLGLELKSLAAYTDILDPSTTRSRVIDNFKRVIDYASEARIKFVVTESGGVPGELDEWDEMIERFSELTWHAETHGVVILIENGPGVLVNSTGLMMRMMEELDTGSIGINFDPANLLLVPDDVINAVNRLGDLIMDTHAKDSILLTEGSDRDVPEEHIFVMPEGEDFIHLPEGVKWVLPPIGRGDVPFTDYISALKEISFQGDLIIEYQGGGNRENAIIQSKNYLEKILSED